MKKIIFTLFAFCSLTMAEAQIHENILISNSSSPNEPSIYIDPSNTSRMVAGANLNNVYYSDDGGYTWMIDQLYSSEHGVYGDPVILADYEGNFYYFHLSNPPAGSWIDRIVCQKSTDGGATWNDGSAMGLNNQKEQDKEWAVCDPQSNTIYVTWTQFDSYGSGNPADVSKIRFSKSTDAGENWSETININEVDGDCIDDDNTVEGAVPAVGPEGEVFVAWSGPEGIVFDRSLDGGESWLENDIFVCDHVGGWAYDIPGIYRANGMPITVCDISGGPNHGTIYINFSDQRNGINDTDVWLTKSTDMGNTWSEPIRVNNDETQTHQFFTWMSIDQTTGYLWFVWYDRRNYTDWNTDVYMAVSQDGGNTFHNFLVSEEPFYPNSGNFFGDYTCVSAHDNIVRPIWTRLHNNQKSIYTAIIDVDAVISGENENYPIPYAQLEPNFPNPFTESTSISFKLNQPAVISLKVFDVFGREVATIIEGEKRLKGKYTEQFDSVKYNLAEGAYYFSLTGNGINLKRKMMLVN